MVINTLNEEANLQRALKSVESLAFEVVVVDMYSDDDTVKIAKESGARVFSHKRTGYVEPARNYAIAKTRGDWVLILDADEEVPKSLVRKLLSLVKEGDADYYAVPRKNIIFDKWIKHSNWWPDYNVRFFRRGSVHWAKEIHSVPITEGRGADVPPEEDFALVHHHYSSVDQYMSRLNRYTTVQAKEKKRRGAKPDWKRFIASPSSEFLSRYFAGSGYKDGIHGLALALLQAFSEFIVEIKLWELSKFSERGLSIEEVSGEIKKAQGELNYWTANALISEKGGLINQIKRKFKLP